MAVADASGTGFLPGEDSLTDIAKIPLQPSAVFNKAFRDLSGCSLPFLLTLQSEQISKICK